MNEYFFPGYNAEYGLYDGIHNRFVLVSSDSDTLVRCILLLSSKAHLYIVPLTQAPNYSANLMDNYCCQNWGIASTAGADLFSEVQSADKLTFASVPALCQNPEPVSELEKELQKFAFLAHHVTQYWQTNSRWYYRDFYDYIAWPVELQQKKIQERSMYHAIYNAVCYAQAEQQIQDLMC